MERNKRTDFDTKYKEVKRIAKGGFGEVYEYERLNSNVKDNVAVKIINY